MPIMALQERNKKLTSQDSSHWLPCFSFFYVSVTIVNSPLILALIALFNLNQDPNKNKNNPL
jgi:hypothetical protein